MKSIKQFGKKGRLSLRYVWPFHILEKIGPVAWMIGLPDYFGVVHNVFLVSSLKKSFGWQESLLVDLRSTQFQPNLTYK